MTDQQWNDLLRVLGGELIEPLPVGLIIDSPWLAGWHGVSMMDYFSDDEAWWQANLKAVRRFPDVWFLPGFWAEYGMCTEPSAFGGRCGFPENEFPFAEKMLHDYADVDKVTKPKCRVHGLCPFVIKRLARYRGKIEAEGHRIRFATSRGHFNIASYLLGHTELMIGVKTNPHEVHRLLDVVTDFVVDWLQHQAAEFDSIDGILVLDDLIGFLGEADFRQFAVPYLKRISDAVDCSVKILHNDCHGLITARHMAEMGYNVFNFSFEHPLDKMQELCGRTVTLLGNVPPRDVLALGKPDDVARIAAEALAPVKDRRRIILSAGGGTPPGVSDENIDALVAAARDS
jgi:uroporphyrinogen decarboxylase